jgi:conjugative transfer region protein TrbK
MRGRLLNLPAIARAVGFALVAVAIIAATLHFRGTPLRSPNDAASSAATSDPLSDELKRCQVLAGQAKDDADCEAVWAESRRRFFTYRPPSTTAPPTASAKSPDR